MNYFSEELTIDTVEELDLDDNLWLEFNYDNDYKIYQEEENFRYLICTNAVHVPRLNTDIHYAIGECFNNITNEWEVDHDIFIFTEADNYNFLYSENSAMKTCIHNYCNINNIEVGYIGDLACYLIKK